VFDMLFEQAGRVAARYRWIVVAVWLILTVVITVLAPNIDSVASSDTRDLLPANAPFQQAGARLNEYFPGEISLGSAVIVVETTGQTIHEAANWNYLVALTKWLQSSDAPRNITKVVSPASTIPLLADAMIAKDGHLALIQVNFSSNTHDTATMDALRALDEHLAKNTPDGVKAYLTGTAPIVDSYTTAALASVDSTLGITVILVVLILLLVYRSPVSPILPLLTVAAAYLITRGIVGFLGKYVMTISSFTNVFLIVVLFGAGTDYCLFLISRFREEVADDNDIAESTRRTVHRVGETITSSAGTVIVGFVTMAFAEMGLFRTTGPALAIGVVVILVAGLTLTPALLAILGERAFWPGRASHRAVGRLSAQRSEGVVQHPVRTIVIILLILLPLPLIAASQRVSYDMMSDLPPTYGARAGYQALTAHMDGGQLQPLNVIIQGFKPETALQDIATWADKLRATDGVADVRSLSAPLGAANSTLQDITRVSRQLALAADALGSLRDQAQAGSLDSSNLSLALNALSFARSYFDALERKFPRVAGDPDLAAIRQALSGLPGAALTGTLDQSVQSLQEHLTALSKTFESIDGAYYLPDALPKSLVDALGGQDPLLMLTSRYVTADRTVAQFEVVLKGSPFGDEAMNTVEKLRAMLPDGVNAISGYPVAITDLRDTMQRDTTRAIFFVLAGIFVVLLALLRAIIPPIYLILSILLSYGATIGITRVASEVLWGTDALTWWVPFFMFVLLVALGMDYNIFLMGRVKEEARRYGMVDGVRRAAVATGAIITSAGIIMAGTFSAMMSSVIVGLSQLGFAVAVGVLMDTFIIRGMLIPAVVVLLNRWNWWPGRAPHVEPVEQPAASR
jgi:RND superfamily putative drug exporter